VKTSDSVSEIRKCGTVSVGQGSIGGPLLFLLFINDVTELPLKGRVTLSADDTTITLSAKTYTELEMLANNDLSLINEWLLKNRLILNSKKSNYMVMGRPRTETTLDIRIGQQTINRVTELKILGIIWNHDMSFKPHTTDICNTISKRLSYLSRLKEFLTIPLLKQIFNAIILPVFDYGSTVWSHTYPTHLKRIVSLQKRATRIVLKEGYEYPFNASLKRLNWLPIESRMIFNSNVYIFKALNGMASDYSKNFFKLKNTRNSTRINDDKTLELPKPNNEFFKNTIFYTGVKNYNSMSYHIRSSERLSTFKRLLFNFLSNN
jgi:hypothetical protein